MPRRVVLAIGSLLATIVVAVALNLFDFEGDPAPRLLREPRDFAAVT